MIAMMLRRAAALEGAAAVDEEEQCTGALIGTYLGAFMFLYPIGSARGSAHLPPMQRARIRSVPSHRLGLRCHSCILKFRSYPHSQTVASVRAFFLAMAMYPDIQRKAQEELDRVVGRTRLPDFEDRNNLPYVNAVVKELTRWNVVAPMGLPHAALEDDEYNGYFIPKGSIVIANVW